MAAMAALFALVVVSVFELRSKPVKFLGSLGGRSSAAAAINDSGAIVGDSSTGITQQVFMWRNEDGMIALNTESKVKIEGRDMSFDGSYATDINDRGAVVGFFFGVRSELKTLAFLWTKENGMIGLGTLGGRRSEAFSLNDDEMVVGISTTSDGGNRAFLWTKNEGMSELGAFDGDDSRAYAINNTGMVVGAAKNSRKEERAFLWTKQRGMEDLGTLGGRESAALAINAAGVVVGRARNKTGDMRAFMWSEEDGIKDLGTLGGDSSCAYGINDDGVVVGDAKSSDGKKYAFIWTPENGMRRLDNLACNMSSAVAINKTGQIAGYLEHCPPWWVRVWEWGSEKLGLPAEYCPNIDNFSNKEAVLWNS